MSNNFLNSFSKITYDVSNSVSKSISKSKLKYSNNQSKLKNNSFTVNKEYDDNLDYSIDNQEKKQISEEDPRIKKLNEESENIRKNVEELKASRKKLEQELLDYQNKKNKNNNSPYSTTMPQYTRANEYSKEEILKSQIMRNSSEIHKYLDRLSSIESEKHKIAKENNIKKYLSNSKGITDEELEQFENLAIYAPFLFSPESMDKKKENGHGWEYDRNGYDSYSDLINTMKNKGYTIEDIDKIVANDKKINWDKVESALSKGITNLDILLASKLKKEDVNDMFYSDSCVVDFINKIEYMQDSEISEAYNAYTNQGVEGLRSYLKSKNDELNRREGLYKALRFLSSVDMDDPNYQDYIKTHFKGLEDGLDQFGHGMEVFLSPIDSLSSDITSNQYEAIFIATMLSKSNSNFKGILKEYNLLEKVYNLSMAEGNVLPSMLAGTLGNFFGLGELGAFTMFCSVTGTSAESAYQQGYDIYSSWFYGSLNGASEATLESLLGGIPGIKNFWSLLDKNLLTRMFSEGLEESLQEVIDPFLRAAVLGEPLKIDPNKIWEAGIDGMILAAYLNGGSIAIGNTTIGAEALEFLQNNYQHFKNNNTSTNEIVEILDKVQELKSKGVDIDYSKIIEDGYVQSLYDSSNNNANYIERRVTIDGTSELVPINTILKLLNDKEYVSKFLNYDQNTNIFLNSKQSIISAVELYVEQITGGNVNSLIPDALENYNIIINQSEAITDFGTILENGKIRYTTSSGVDYEAPSAYLNNLLFDQIGYNNFQQALSTASTLQAYNTLLPFRALYLKVKSQDVILDSKTMSRLENLNNEYISIIGKNKQILGKYTEYGANQHAVMNVALSPASNPKLYTSLENIVKSYFPNIRRSNIFELLRGIDVNGVCSYATVVNELLIEYNGREADFKRDFGYDLYRIENGQFVINAEEIITDLYCFANANNVDIFSQNGLFQHIGNDKSAICMSYGGSGKNTYIINSWLHSKGINANLVSSVFFTSNNALTDANITQIKNQVSATLSAGNQVELDFFMDKDSTNLFYLYPTNVNESPYLMNSSHHSAGHSVEVTGIDNNGDLIISSWGKEFIIRFEELKNIKVTFIHSRLLYNN